MNGKKCEENLTIMPIDDYYEEGKEETTCCDPFLEPGVLSNPKSFEGHRCCPDGTWGNSIGDTTNFACGEEIIPYPNGKVCGICSLPADAGPCEAFMPSWFFNGESGMCEEFFYGGCEGNANKFKVKKDCEQLCPRNSCCNENLSPICPTGVAKCCPEGEWSCPDNEGYYMCEGDRLEILREGLICEIEKKEKNSTLIPTNDDICSFPADIGPCEAIFPSWFFNAESGKCEEFDYGGCDGNVNKFKSKNRCEEFCPTSMDINENTMDNMDENHNMNMGENVMDNMDENHNMNMGENGMSSMENNILYCAVGCLSSPDDPCGDGMAQTSSCSSTIESGKHMVGCALTACQKLCNGIHKESDVNMADDDVYCFPSKVGMAMYTQQEIAEISAISRGCEGAHEMQGTMYMIGATHMACEGAYKREGVTFTGCNDNEKDFETFTTASTPTSSSSTATKLKSTRNKMTMTIVALFSLFLFF